MSYCCKNKKKHGNKVDSQLNCKATAELDSQIVDDLMAEDAALKDLLATDTQEENADQDAS